MLGICTHVNKYLDLKYKYKYFKHVLEYNSSTSTHLWTNMLEELDCKDVKVMKSIRLRKYTNGMQDRPTTNTGSSSTEPKPRPVRLVLSYENEKNNSQ